MSDEKNHDEQMRPCHICRMPISVLATKCRYCGAQVGRPRVADTEFTADDLGGETKSTYTLSGNVMDALEAFREEEVSALEEERQHAEAQRRSSLFRRKTPPVSTKESADSPQSAKPRDLAGEFLDDYSSRPKPAPSSPSPSLLATVTWRVFLVGAVAAGLTLLYLGTDFAWGYISGDSGEQADSLVENLAMDMLDRGDPAIEAFEHAIAVLDANGNRREDQNVARTVRERLLEELEADLVSPDFGDVNLTSISSILARAEQLDMGQADIAALRERVDRELQMHKMVLQSTDTDAQTATFRINNPDYREDGERVREQTVTVGELVQGRFLVKFIASSYVRLDDTEVADGGGQRSLMARRLEPITAG